MTSLKNRPSEKSLIRANEFLLRVAIAQWSIEEIVTALAIQFDQGKEIILPVKVGRLGLQLTSLQRGFNLALRRIRSLNPNQEFKEVE